MKIAGIIAEYNPFHTGHAYHMEKTREKCGADYIICVISGHFTQRGEPAVYDKWARARAALQNGADLVLELPFFYATQSAEGFASGGVRILDALHCVDFLSFGAENADIGAMERAASILADEPPEFQSALKNALSKGVSFPAARAEALCSALPGTAESLWTQPNNILGIEYLKALHRAKSRIEAVSIAREGASYSSTGLHAKFSSANAIRAAIRDGNPACVPFVPGYAEYGDPVFPEAMFPFLLFSLRRMGVKGVGKIEGVSEGLEYRICEAARAAADYTDLVEKIKSKRFTYTRIQRVLLYCLFGVTKEKAAALKNESLYARVLGVREQSLPLLSLISAESAVPVVTKASGFPDSDLFRLDVLATDVYSLFTKKTAPAGRDFTERFPVI